MQKPTVVELTCQERAVGQKELEKLRSELLIPAVIYGPTVKENIHIAIPELDLEKILSQSATQIVKIKVGKKTYETLLKRTEFHPVTDRPLHADFYALDDKHDVTITVPIHLEGTAIGVTEGGGRLFQPLRKIRVRCKTDSIPAVLTLNISKLGIGDSLKVEELDTEGFTPLIENYRTIVVVRPPKGGLKSILGLDEDEEELEEGAEGAEGAEAAAEGADASAEESKE